MPRVPTAEGFGVLPTIRSGGARPVLSVEQAAQPGRQMEARGAQMIKIGGQIGDYAQQQQERINRVRVQSAYVQAQNFGRELELEQRKINGEAVIGTTEAFGERYSKRISELAKDLSPIAQEAFRAKADTLYGGFLDRGTKYEADQFDLLEKQVIDASFISSSQNLLVYKDDPVKFAESRQETKDALVLKANANDITDPAAVELFVQGEMGKTHKLLIDSMLDGGDPRGAAAYFAQVSEDFLPLAAEDMKNKIDAGLAPAEASTLVDAVLAEFPLDGLNIPTSDMNSWLRANIDNPVVLKAAQEDLRSRIAAHKEQYDNEQADAYQTSLDIGKDRGIAAMRGTAAFQSLSPRDQLAIEDYFISRQAGAEARAAAAEGRAAAAETRKKSKLEETQNETFFDIVYTEAGIDTLAKMTPGSVRMLRSAVGERNFGALLKTYEKLNEGPERVYEVTLDNNDFNAMAIRYGYDPFSKEPKDKRSIVQLRATLESAIAAEQNRVGKLDPEQKQKVLQKVFMGEVEGAMVPSYVPVRSGLFGERKQVSTFDLTPEQAASIRTEDIPYADRLEIVAALGETYNDTGDERFNPENPNNIRAMYLATRGVGVTND